MPLHRTPPSDASLSVNPLFAHPGMGAIPKDRLPDGPMDPAVAYQAVHDELLLDGNARQNLATFVTTWMDPQARQLMAECAEKNMIDKDEYPQTAELEERCVKMIAGLWHAPGVAVGCSTVGSSEACMLGGLALKRRWQHRGGTGAPNLVMGANVQVVWEKFCGYWDVEPRYVPMQGERFHLDAETAVAHCDENTIGVVAILGSTFDGSYEPVAEIAAALDALQAERGIDVPLHVDAASGGFIAPFVDADLEWDFRLPRVASINASGHKFGLVSPGVGWALWRDHAALPEELVYNVDYLGGNMPTFTLNFSRPGSQVVAQYYQFIRLGVAGFRSVQQECRNTALRVAAGLAELDDVRVLTDGSELPVLAFTLADHVTDYTVYDVSERLRSRGWIVPAYQFPADRQDLHVLRVVVRNGFGADLADLFVTDVARLLPRLAGNVRASAPEDVGFHH
ncbi:MAG: glutamate decarboxylase [Solirubrobacteraceae bacterium]|nr:glutamate decarboxylase [Solirubrobacteraceae bacterium]